MSNIFVSIVAKNQAFNETMGYRPGIRVHNGRVLLGMPKIVSWPKFISAQIICALITLYAIAKIEEGRA